MAKTIIRNWIEEVAQCLQMRVTLEYGGADWNRTSDPLLAKQVLSQLSYSPVLM